MKAALLVAEGKISFHDIESKSMRLLLGHKISRKRMARMISRMFTYLTGSIFARFLPRIEHGVIVVDDWTPDDKQEKRFGIRIIGLLTTDDGRRMQVNLPIGFEAIQGKADGDTLKGLAEGVLKKYGLQFSKTPGAGKVTAVKSDSWAGNFAMAKKSWGPNHSLLGSYGELDASKVAQASDCGCRRRSADEDQSDRLSGARLVCSDLC
jgi:hypothetical protein